MSKVKTRIRGRVCGRVLVCVRVSVTLRVLVKGEEDMLSSVRVIGLGPCLS